MDLEALQHTIDKLSPEKRAKFEDLHKEILERPWIPNPGPQTDAYKSKADILLYGGAAGGGKTDLLCGLAWHHERGFIVRRTSTELDGIIERSHDLYEGKGDYNKVERTWKLDNGSLKFGGMQYEADWRDYAGRARDYMGFDEAAEFLEVQIKSIMAWLRHEDKDHKCRLVLATNPPRGAEGEWIIRWFAPWLDPLYANPAAPGELRWAIWVGDEQIWCDGPETRIIDGEEYIPKSYTFIPALLDDNPYYKDNRDYRATLQSLPEPLRSQLLKGDFTAGQEDDEWQVIPSEWVDLAFERWEKAENKTRRMIALSADIGQGGSGDPTTLAALHTDCWFAPIKEFREDVKDGYKVASLIVKERRDNADLSLDLTGGWGAAPQEALERDFGLHVTGLVASAKSGRYSRDRRFGFVNQRAEWWWLFREGLDPNNHPEDLPKLPPDPKLKAQLCAPTWRLKGTNIQIEEKAEIKKRLGASTDRADAVIQVWSRREYAALMSGLQAQEWTEAEKDDDPFEGI